MHGLPYGTSWAAGRNYDWGIAGFKDTESDVGMKLAVRHGSTQVYVRIQATLAVIIGVLTIAPNQIPPSAPLRSRINLYMPGAVVRANSRAVMVLLYTTQAPLLSCNTQEK
jgi:hypothetical protein